MIIECHVIFIENLTENSDENSDESFIVFHFDFAIRNHHDNADQNSCSIAESYFSLF